MRGGKTGSIISGGAKIGAVGIALIGATIVILLIGLPLLSP